MIVIIFFSIETIQIFYSTLCITPAKEYNKFARSISESLHLWGTKIFLLLRAVGNTVSNLTGLRFGSQAYRSRDESVTAQPPYQ